MSRYALVDQTNKVANLALWDGNTDTWQPPAGLTVVHLPNDSLVGVGDTVDANGNVTAKAAVPPEIINGATIGAWLDNLITQGENAVANWAGLTPAQKDNAAKQTVQAVTRLARLARNNLSSPGA